MNLCVLLTKRTEFRTKAPNDRRSQRSLAASLLAKSAQYDCMPDRPIELSIEVPTETRQAIERAAAERGVTVSKYLEETLRKILIDAGYLGKGVTH